MIGKDGLEHRDRNPFWKPGAVRLLRGYLIAPSGSVVVRRRLLWLLSGGSPVACRCVGNCVFFFFSFLFLPRENESMVVELTLRRDSTSLTRNQGFLVSCTVRVERIWDWRADVCLPERLRGLRIWIAGLLYSWRALECFYGLYSRLRLALHICTNRWSRGQDDIYIPGLARPMPDVRIRNIEIPMEENYTTLRCVIKVMICCTVEYLAG